jgi:hypothetical protein
MIDVACPKCGTVYHTLEANVGKRILCTSNLPGRQQKCGNVITVEPHAIAQQPPSSPTTSRRATPSPAKRWLPYLLAITVVVAVTLVWRMFPRHTDTATQVLSAKPDVEAPPSSGATDSTKNGQKQKVAGEESLPAPSPPSPSDFDEFVRKQKVEAPRSGSTQHSDTRPTEYNSPQTGTRLQPDVGTGGHGELTVENGTTEDAVVRLSDVTTDQTVRWFFVRARSSAHVSQMPPGSYRLTYTTGLDWVESEDSFKWRPSYIEFGRTLDYSEQRDSEGVQYRTVNVTLHPVISGNVRARAITREEFLRGHRHVALQR